MFYITDIIIFINTTLTNLYIHDYIFMIDDK